MIKRLISPFLVAAVALVAGPAIAQDKPNIVLVLMDNSHSLYSSLYFSFLIF